MKRVIPLLSVVLLVSSSAFAGERLYLLRSVEDPSLAADPTVCAGAPFKVNLRLVASLYTVAARLSDGKIVYDEVRKVGVANACGQVTNFAFPSGLQQNFHVRFDLPSGSYTATGTCTLTSNNVPKGGVVLAGCALNVISAPPGTVGGILASASVLNPFKLSGFNTGSMWTLHVYDDSTATGPGRAEGNGLEPFHDERTDEQIAAAQKAQEG